MKMMKKILVVMVLALIGAQGGVYSIADITPGGSTVALASSNTKASWVQLVAPSTNSGTIRVGGSTTDSTHGIAMAPGGGMFFNTLGNSVPYDLQSIYVYGTSTDKVSVAYFKN